MISTRYLIPVLLLLALAAMPTVIHSYRDSSVHDGRSTGAIPMTLAGERGAPTTRRPGWGEDRFSATDWTERRYGTPEVKLFVGRSFDPKRLYHHPELAVDYGPSYRDGGVIRLAPRPDVPVHVLTSGGDNRGRVAMYVLHAGDGYIDDPIRFQLRSSFQMLFSGRRAMTLFFAAQDVPPDRPVETSRAAALLLAAVAAFEAQTPSANP